MSFFMSLSLWTVWEELGTSKGTQTLTYWTGTGAEILRSTGKKSGVFGIWSSPDFSASFSPSEWKLPDTHDSEPIIFLRSHKATIMLWNNTARLSNKDFSTALAQSLDITAGRFCRTNHRTGRCTGREVSLLSSKCDVSFMGTAALREEKVQLLNSPTSAVFWSSAGA